MKIVKILNNNAVVVQQGSKDEQIIMGRGIAFQKRCGDSVDHSKIEKIFARQNNRLFDHFVELIQQIPLNILLTCDRIVTYAREQLGPLQDSLFISLADHCFGALERKRNGITLHNRLLWETQHLYPNEYQVAVYALKIIEQRLGVSLKLDEAGFITLHFVTAQLQGDMQEVTQVTRLMQEMLNLVKYHLCIEYDDRSLRYQRFVTHLKFFAQRCLSHTPLSSEDHEFTEAIRQQYSVAWAAAEVVGKHLTQHYQHPIQSEELLFLTLHIEKLRKEAQ
ncbi:PRD domain-containing protein [Rosenbergiella collisarenosi]|uniref:BglG family transcription antiterminator LicT n=1 Tax=Rosenbergiella collisarenosi TaxID=1544695 RepID=UPI001BDB14A1|nr:PRD domain-containing protein [Rosenbergiella collisarenosi]MBT0719898.1 PRD domain-containing protein [Rosenbergiella collisarenosi]